MAAHSLLFLDPGHFHAALTLRERHALAHDEILVYAPHRPDDPRGGELAEFLALVEAFNRRAERPTAWRVEVRAGADPLGRLLSERAGDVAVLAGRNDSKMAAARRLHDAGIHVLADKPWMTRAAALADIRHVLGGGARVMEMMTGRYARSSIVAERLVRDAEVFGGFQPDDGGPAIRLASVHHLEKVVNGAPLRRPAWFFDVRVQGDGVADIPTHLVDQAQRFLAASGAPARGAELSSVRRWSTPVPRAVFARVTGVSDFPDDLRAHVEGDTLAYAANAELAFRLSGVDVHLATRWGLTEPPGGGDEHSATLSGRHARLRIEQGPATGFRRRIVVEPRGNAARLEAALARAVAAAQPEFPGLAVVAARDGFEVAVPAGPGTAHESQFPLVLDELLGAIAHEPWPDARAADTLAKYELLARALSG